jgi:hypothetical protein
MNITVFETAVLQGSGMFRIAKSKSDELAQGMACHDGE